MDFGSNSNLTGIQRKLSKQALSEPGCPIRNIKTLIFDCDGLLVDSEELSFEARSQAAARFGHQLREEDFLYFWFDGNGGTGAFCQKYTLPLEEFQEIKRTIYDEFIQSRLKLCPGVQAFLDAMKDRYALALCSNSSKRDLEKILDRFSLRKYFEVVVSGNDLHHGKPDPEGFLLAAKKTGVEPSEALIFENSHIGLAAANAAGIKCIIIPDKFGKKFRFSAAEMVLERIDEAVGILK
jgi:HAD superfamily hydrolase (TIGR01509 family)